MDNPEGQDRVGVTIEEAARLLMVSRKTIEKLIDNKMLLAFTIGDNPSTGKLRVSYDSLKSLPAVKQIDPAARSSRRFAKG